MMRRCVYIVAALCERRSLGQPAVADRRYSRKKMSILHLSILCSNILQK